MAGHEKRAHALLSASGASRWLNCTPSAKLGETVESTTSVYAQEGTLAHEFAELELRKESNQIILQKYSKEIEKLRSHNLYTDDMEGEVQKYVDYVLEEFGLAKTKTSDAVLLLEQSIDLREYIEEGFGTNDAVIVADNVMTVIDLKYGKGIKVNANNNPQLMLYGLGALSAFDMMYDIKEVKLVIVQPRLDHISEWTLKVEDLQDWGEHEVKVKAKLAYAGEGLQQAGDWCQWCPVKAKCGTLASFSLKCAQDDYTDPRLLKDDRILEIYKRIDLVSLWIEAVKEYVYTEAINGKNWPGYKLVEGKSNRAWKDAEDVETFLIEAGCEKEDITQTKLLGIGAIEKLLGKVRFNSVLTDLIVKPQGKPTLVPNSDKRPPFSSALKDFEN